MKFNVDGLEFLKKTTKMDKDETFVLGFIIGNIAAFEVTMAAEGMPDDEIKVVIKEVYDNETIIKLWNEISIDLELNTRPIYEILPEFLN